MSRGLGIVYFDTRECAKLGASTNRDSGIVFSPSGTYQDSRRGRVVYYRQCNVLEVVHSVYGIDPAHCIVNPRAGT